VNGAKENKWGKPKEKRVKPKRTKVKCRLLITKGHEV